MHNFGKRQEYRSLCRRHGQHNESDFNKELLPGSSCYSTASTVSKQGYNNDDDKSDDDDDDDKKYDVIYDDNY